MFKYRGGIDAQLLDAIRVLDERGGCICEFERMN